MPSRFQPAVTTEPIVWIVDDSALEAELAQRCLSGACQTRTFADGSAMLEQLAVERLPDVLVLDWVMPGVSGVEVCRFLRAQEATSELSILLLTGRGSSDGAEQTGHLVDALSAGANDYLTKPYAPAELQARVSALVRATRLRERALGAERSLRALLSHLPDPLITTDASGLITFLNAEAERILGIQTAAAKDRHVSEFFVPLAKIHELHLDADVFEALPELTLGGSLYAPAVRRMVLDGVPTIAVSLRDVTEKRRLELRRLDFYSMVAHDLRSPLAAMSIRVEMMKLQRHGPLPEKYLGDLELVGSRINELVELINDFLDVARSEGVGLTLEREQVDLAALVHSNLTDFEQIALASDVTIRLVEPSAPVQTDGDPARLKQVITNLISNAVKFSPKGGEVKIEVSRTAAEVEFAVSDVGRGIPEDKIAELFQRYSRPATDAALPGTGLGLMIVREIVAAHAGTCGVTSTVGAGSRFWFRLPDAPPCVRQSGLSL